MSNSNAVEYVSSKTATKSFNINCVRNNDFFNTSEWHKAVESLGATVKYHWSDRLGDGFSTSIFKKGPFSIAYVGFPDGNRTITRIISDEKTLSEILQGCFSMGVNAVRIAGLMWDPASLGKYQCDDVMVSQIEDLSLWDFCDLSASIHRNIRKAERSGVRLTNCIHTDNAMRMHTLYQDTVKRHKGESRYTLEYFQSLLEIASKKESAVQVYSAYLSDELIAYTVTANHQSECVYLHGAQQLSRQNLRSMDALFKEMITKAKKSNLKTFSFQASPKHQIGLIKYKEKWGAVSRSRFTITAYGTGITSTLLRLAINARHQ